MIWRIFKAQRLRPYRMLSLLVAVLLFFFASVAQAGAPLAPGTPLLSAEVIAQTVGAYDQ